MMDKHQKNIEQRLRRALNKAGYSMHKSRAGISIDNLGGYMISDHQNNAVVVGSRFDYTLEEVEEWFYNN